jgi:hypothetical protein
MVVSTDLFGCDVAAKARREPVNGIEVRYLDREWILRATAGARNSPENSRFVGTGIDEDVGGIHSRCRHDQSLESGIQ